MPAKKKSEPVKPILLNEEQQAVVSAREGSWCCMAGPGSGKSACVTARYCALIQEGVSPDQILSLSFTRSAAKNLRDRVEAQVGKLSINRKVAGAVTFHSLALSFALEERTEYGFELADNPLAAEPIANKFASEVSRKFDTDGRILRPAVSLWKRRRISPASAIRDCENRIDAKQLKLALAYKGYQKLLKENGLLDFDDLGYFMVEILEKRPEARGRWQYQYVMVDETQDCCQIEWALLKLISEQHKNLLAVGDASQGIYGFRGSDPRLFSAMNEIFPGTQTLYMGCNYRSTPEIISFIRPIASSKELAEKFHTTNPSGPIPEIRGFNSPVEEAKWICAKIKGDTC